MLPIRNTRLLACYSMQLLYVPIDILSNPMREDKQSGHLVYGGFFICS